LALGMLCIAAVPLARGIEMLRRSKGRPPGASADVYDIDTTPMLLMNAEEEFEGAIANETGMGSRSAASCPHNNGGGFDWPITRSGRVEASRADIVDP